ncbi:MAG: response regulator [Spirochaetes bacterium]|nr:response regulator [Spirochaetota bacterium]
MDIINNSEKKILIVDDEKTVRDTISKFLSRMGYITDTAEDGRIAINKLTGNPYDLVITDLKMPNVDGRILLQFMSDNLPTIPKIVLTGYGEDKDIIIALKSGASDFLYKPIGDFAILMHSIQKALSIKEANDERDRYLKELRQINEIISLLNKGKSTEDIFKSLSTNLKKIIPFNKITLCNLDRAKKKVITRLIESDQPIIMHEGYEMPVDDFIFENDDNVGTILLNDLEEHSKKDQTAYITSKPLLEEGMQSLLMMPLKINNVIRGFLGLSSTEKGFFQKRHISFMESIAGQIALSIERGSLLEELGNHTKELEHQVQTRTNEIFKTQRTTLFALSKLAESRDPETGEHLERIRRYSVLTAQIYKYTHNDKNITNLFLRDLYDSSILHDIGKVGIPDTILLKEGPLTNEEQEIIRTHIHIGYDALKKASKSLGENSFLNMAMEIILYHHEHWDGSGYPFKLKGEKIPLSARIVTISDVYDALRSKRPYKKAYTHEKTLEIMKQSSGFFDPVLFKIFLDNSREFDLISTRYQDQ